MREFRALAGVGAVAFVLAAISIVLAGPEGIMAWIGLLLAGLPNTYPEAMVNWRALAVTVLGIGSPELAWSLATLGMALTFGLAVAMWRRPMPHGSPRESVVLLASYAAAMAVSWHAHVPVALPMNALLIYAAEKQVLPRAFLEVWCVVPGLLFLLVAFASGPAEAHRVAGLTLLALNGYLVMWAARYIWRGRSRLPLGALR